MNPTATPNSYPLHRIVLWSGIAVFVIVASLLLPAIYSRPFTIRRDIGSQWLRAEGVYRGEHNDSLSYAYTDGAASLAFPESGVGRFVVALRLGGPGGSMPVTAHLTANDETIDLGTVQALRTYHLLVDSDPYGDLVLHASSTTASLPNENRALGMLLDWIDGASLDQPTPPIAITVLTPLIMLLVVLVVSWRVPTVLLRLCLIIATTLALGGSYALGRGLFAVAPWWFLGFGGLATVLGMQWLGRKTTWTANWRITGQFVLWRCLLCITGAVGLWYSAEVAVWATQITHTGEVYQRTNFWRHTLVDGWSRWDGLHYQSIAAQGYTLHGDRFPTIAFFPLYPLVTRILGYVIGDVPVASLLVSNLALLAALLLLDRLLTDDFGATLAEQTRILLLLFPAALFFGAAYSESLAFLLLVAVVWALRRQHWWLAGVCGALLTLTRIPGVLTAPLITLLYLQHIRWRWRAIRPDLLAILLPPLALLGFMAYQWWRFDTPFAFLLAQRAWKNELSPPWVIPLTLIAEIGTTFDREMKVFQLIIWASFIGLVGLAVRRLPLVYGLAALLLVLPVYFSSWPSSIARHVLIIFPAFIVLAQSTHRPILRYTLQGVMVVLMIVGTLLFVNRFWVG